MSMKYETLKVYISLDLDFCEYVNIFYIILTIATFTLLVI